VHATPDLTFGDIYNHVLICVENSAFLLIMHLPEALFDITKAEFQMKVLIVRNNLFEVNR